MTDTIELEARRAKLGELRGILRENAERLDRLETSLARAEMGVELLAEKLEPALRRLHALEALVAECRQQHSCQGNR